MIHHAPKAARPDDRRARADRRRRFWWAVWYGNFNPRRRADARRGGDEHRFQWIDWHSPHLLAVAVGIGLLSVCDAFLTLGLLQEGAREVNPLMAAVVYRSAAAFTALKMLLTGGGVVLMVVVARYRFMRRIPVAWALYGILLGYCGLIGYELWLRTHLAGAFAL